MKDDVQEPKLLASEDEVRVNEEALARREKKEPSGKKHMITLRPFYCKGCGLCVDICPTGVLLLSGNKRSKWGHGHQVRPGFLHRVQHVRASVPRLCHPDRLRR